MSGIEDDDDLDGPAMDRAQAKCLAAMNRAMKGLTKEEGRLVALVVGADCLISGGDGLADPLTEILNAFRVILEGAVDKGWLKPGPPGSAMVLVLPPGAVDGPLQVLTPDGGRLH